MSLASTNLSEELRDLQRSMVELTEALNSSMAQQLALEHVVCALLENNEFPASVIESLNGIAGEFCESVGDSNPEVISEYVEEIDRYVDLLEVQMEDIEE